MDGPWYVFSTREHRFLRRARLNDGWHKQCKRGEHYLCWTTTLSQAMAYKNPSNARRWAGILNAEAPGLGFMAMDTPTALNIEEVLRSAQAEIQNL